MSSPDNFDSLEKLLKLKRYEQPPPRYFDTFSGRVMSRIEAGEARASWWERFGFDLRPAFAAAAGVLACGLVVYGVATADANVELGTEQMSAGIPLPISPAANAFVQSDPSPANSTNPVPAYGTPIDHKVFGGAGLIRASFPSR